MDVKVAFDFTQQAKIKVFGVGGGGGNAVEHMIANHVEDVVFICANTDAQALARSSAEHKIQLGPQLTKGLGAGAKPEIGQQAAEESLQEIAKYLQDTDMIFITAGMGGGTGTGAAPIIAKMAKDKGILTIGVVTKPFSRIEGKRVRVAAKGIEELRQHVDSLITIPNDRLISMASKNTSAKEMFMKANDVLLSAVRGVTEIITKSADMNLDFADIKTAMSMQGAALMGEGVATGENRALEATKQAIHSPLLEDVNIAGAKALIINISGSNISMPEFFEVSEYINNIATSGGEEEEPEVFIGMAENENINDELRVIIIATGFAHEDSVLAPTSSSVIQFNDAKKQKMVKEEVQETPKVRHSDVLRTPYYDTENHEDMQFPRSRHTPGAEDFTFDSDAEDIPTFIRRQAN